MSAEENLHRAIRSCEGHGSGGGGAGGFIVRVQFDLYHEIRKNGNEKSLRLSLQLFAHYCHLIKQRKTKPYALNLLPCIYAVSKRKEVLLIETLSEFLKTFCKYLQICLNENEVVKLIEVRRIFLVAPGLVYTQTHTESGLYVYRTCVSVFKEVGGLLCFRFKAIIYIRVVQSTIYSFVQMAGTHRIYILYRYKNTHTHTTATRTSFVFAILKSSGIRNANLEKCVC